MEVEWIPEDVPDRDEYDQNALYIKFSKNS